MSIQRTSSTRSEENAREARQIDARNRTQRLESASLEQVERFRTLFQTRGDRQLEAHRNDETQRQDHLADTHVSADALRRGALHEEALRYRRQHDDGERSASFAAGGDTAHTAQAGPGETPPPTEQTQHVDAQAFAALLARHVKQLAVSENAGAGGDGQVLLHLADDTLPGTNLLLSRTREGWQLRADVDSRASFDAIREAAPALSRRFAERNLGPLTIDPHFHEA